MRRILLSVAVFCAVGCGEESGSPPTDGNMDAGSLLDAGACMAPDASEPVTVTSAAHRTEPIDYPDPPPAGGDHHPCWADYDVYAKEIPDERWVHNLEHGAVVLLYRCENGCPAEVEALTRFVDTHPRTLLTPYAALPTRFGAVAWGHRLLTDCFDLSAFERFYADHFDHGLESIPGGPPNQCR